jgi:hypothetical protein
MACRQLVSRMTLPPGMVNTKSSERLPSTTAASSTATNRGTGPVRDWCDFGEQAHVLCRAGICAEDQAEGQARNARGEPPATPLRVVDRLST